MYLSLCKLLPVEHSIDDDFVSSTPFYLQVIYLYLAMLALRPKYYFVWTFGELARRALAVAIPGVMVPPSAGFVYLRLLLMTSTLLFVFFFFCS